MTTIQIRVTHLDTKWVRNEVERILHSDVNPSPLLDSAAVTIASWYQSPGKDSRALAALASGAPADVEDLLREIDGALEYGDDHDALRMLADWVRIRSSRPTTGQYSYTGRARTYTVDPEN